MEDKLAYYKSQGISSVAYLRACIKGKARLKFKRKGIGFREKYDKMNFRNIPRKRDGKTEEITGNKRYGQ